MLHRDIGEEKVLFREAQPTMGSATVASKGEPAFISVLHLLDEKYGYLNIRVL
jgi:hypothetical protein